LVQGAGDPYSTSSLVVGGGKVYAADYSFGTTHADLIAATGDMGTAYTDAAGRAATPDHTDLYTGALGGKTLTPGLYKWNSAVGAVSDFTISGGPNDVWIFQISGGLSLAAGVNITLAGGALPKNIFWQVASAVTLGTTSHFEGIILCKTDVTMNNSASLSGRILAQTAVTLNANAVTQPAP